MSLKLNKGKTPFNCWRNEMAFLVWICSMHIKYRSILAYSEHEGKQNDTVNNVCAD